MKHALPHTTLYGPLLDFCSFQGCDYLFSLKVGGNAHYRSEQIIQEFLNELDAQISSTILEQLQRSPYIALMADETTDISVSKELVLYVRYIIPSATHLGSVFGVFFLTSQSYKMVKLPLLLKVYWRLWPGSTFRFKGLWALAQMEHRLWLAVGLV